MQDRVAKRGVDLELKGCQVQVLIRGHKDRHIMEVRFAYRQRRQEAGLGLKCAASCAEQRGRAIEHCDAAGLRGRG
jgi:N12 class adenine-specific DNA methylase